MHWYHNQKFNINFNLLKSAEWTVNNGVRQGGILSPYLFNIYVNELIDNISSMSIGCNLGYLKSNIIAYADDVVLLSPSLSGLQNLINAFDNNINIINLHINSNKSVCMKFSKTMAPLIVNSQVFCGDSLLKFVDEIKYLGFIITSNLCNQKDIIFNRNKFYKQFNVTIRKFSNCNINVLVNLFNTYCLQIYGSNLWFGNFRCKRQLDQFAVGYHKAIKKILKVPYGASNHDCCEILGLLTFKHFLNSARLKFILRILKIPCVFISKIVPFLKIKSICFNELELLFKDVYNVNNILDNDKEALIARIFYIDRREPRSNYITLV